MARVVPQKKQEKVQWYQSHVGVWSDNAAALGLLPADTTALGDLTAAAQAALDDQQAKTQAARAATLVYHAAVAAMADKGADLIQFIKAKAAGSADPAAIYALAQIPAPASPSPLAAPGTPFDLKVELNPDGSLNLSWKCLNPEGSTGTLYEVRRKALNGSSGFAHIGASGTRSFTDDTVAAGTPAVVYEITAVRSTKRGTPGQFIVNFGVGAGGEAFATVAETKMKAA